MLSYLEYPLKKIGRYYIIKGNRGRETSNKKCLPNPKVDKKVKKKSFRLGGKSGGQIIRCKTVHVGVV